MYTDKLKYKELTNCSLLSGQQAWAQESVLLEFKAGFEP
jgi:hypothetical protein